MRTSLFPLFLSVFLFSFANAQDLKEIQKQMQFVEGGTFNMGGGYQYEINRASMYYLGFDGGYADMNKDRVAIGEIPNSNNPMRSVEVPSFYMADKEVTNKQYRDFLVDHVLTLKEKAIFLGRLKVIEKDNSGQVVNLWRNLFAQADEKGLLPDTNCWHMDFPYAYNHPLVSTYLWHPAFDDYPVVGVTWQQANAYCGWLTESVNAGRKVKGLDALPAFRLPTEAEWEYAALGSKEKPLKLNYPFYPWEGTQIWDNKGRIWANIKSDNFEYIGDNYEYTAPVGYFPANGYGLYDMAGNVAEWTQDAFVLNTTPEDSPIQVAPDQGSGSQVASRVTKGGSWADYKYAAQVGSRCRMAEEKGHARVGFRVVRSK